MPRHAEAAPTSAETAPSPAANVTAPTLGMHERAQRLVADHWPVVPWLVVGERKMPPRGFDDWPARATLDAMQVADWFLFEYPSAVPAVVLAGLGVTVVDVDAHRGRPNGFASLVERGIVLDPAAPSGPSVSGLGRHHWFAGGCSTRTHALPGVDRLGGTRVVLVTYDLPPLEVVQAGPRLAVPELLVDADEIARVAASGGRRPTAAEVQAWRSALPPATPRDRGLIAYRLRRLPTYPNVGHGALLQAQIACVNLAADGVTGVGILLDALEAEYVRREWATPEVQRDHDAALAGAIRRVLDERAVRHG